MRAIKMEHALDPRAEILQALGTTLDGAVLVNPVSVLLCMYERPEKTAGGLYMPETAGPRAEDKYQGKVGLIVEMGHLAFKDDEEHDWGPDKPKLGDWAMVRVGDTFPFYVNERMMRIVHENDVRMILPSPDMVY